MIKKLWGYEFKMWKDENEYYSFKNSLEKITKKLGVTIDQNLADEVLEYCNEVENFNDTLEDENFIDASEFFEKHNFNPSYAQEMFKETEEIINYNRWYEKFERLMNNKEPIKEI